LLSWRGKVAPDKLIDKLYQLYFDYDCELMGIETDVYQVALKYWLQERIVNDPDNKSMKIMELKARGKSKEDRISAMGPYVNAGKYKFRKSQSTLMFSLSRFPKAKDRDEADAMAYQLYLIKPASVKVVKNTNPKSLDSWKARIKKLRSTKQNAHYVGG